MPENIKSLGEFGTGTEAEPETNRTQIREYNLEKLTLAKAPNRDSLPAWEPPCTAYNHLQTRRLQIDKSHIKPSNSKLYQEEIKWVTDGDLAKYIDQYGDCEIDIPSAYSNFDEFTPYISRIDSTSGKFAYGIDSESLEHGLRVLTGGGGFRSPKYTLIGCGEHPAVLGGPEGTVLLTPQPVPKKNVNLHGLEPNTLEYDNGAKTRTLEVYEDNGQILRGLVNLLELMTTESDIEINEITNTSQGYTIEPADDREDMMGDVWKIDANTLLTLGTISTEPEKIAAYEEGTVTDPFGTEHTVSWSPEYNYGDIWENSKKAIGWNLAWKSRPGMLDTVAVVNTVFVRYSTRQIRTITVSERLTHVPETPNDSIPEQEH
jgi:hypothetical protein